MTTNRIAPQPDWHDETFTEPIDKRLELFRPPPKGAIQGIILSHTLSVIYTHYFRGRTGPHTEPWCEACENGSPQRQCGYVALYSPTTSRVVVCELTNAALDPIELYAYMHKTLRGAELKLYRGGIARNGKVTSSIKKGDYLDHQLPTCPDVRAFLEKLWDAPTRGHTTNPTQRNPPDLAPPPPSNGQNGSQPH